MFTEKSLLYLYKIDYCSQSDCRLLLRPLKMGRNVIFIKKKQKKM